MKSLLCTLLALTLICTLVACKPDSQTPTPDSTASTQQTTPPTTATTAPTTIATEATQAPTEIATEPTAPTSHIPYKLKIKQPDCPIYKGPGYDYSQNGTVKEAGTFTIVEEEYDEEGILWGKLKSGAGWVDLMRVKEENEKPPLVSVSNADKSLLKSGNYHHWIVDESEYMVQIALRCSQTLSDVILFEIIMTEDADELSKLCAIASWEKDTPIVADVAFPSDFSTYALCVTDKNGTVHWFCIYESGRNGELCLDPYTPQN